MSAKPKLPPIFWIGVAFAILNTIWTVYGLVNLDEILADRMESRQRHIEKYIQEHPHADTEPAGAKPRPVKPIRPTYPAGARQRSEEGDVVLTLDISAQGRVTAASVFSSSGYPELDAEALRVARKARFIPAKSGGAAVATTVRITIEFRLGAPDEAERRKMEQAKKSAIPDLISESFAFLLARAEAGDAEAQFKVGKSFRYGAAGVERDCAQAAVWLRKAAEQGHAQAQSEFGSLLADGKGVEKNEEEAVAWYRKSAEQGNPYGEFNLAGALFSGRGVDKDPAAAFAWYRKSADHGLPLAWFSLGEMYLEGTGVEKDAAEALRWFRKAAESDHEQARVFAQNSIGNCYLHGTGVEQDYKEAVAWFSKSAEVGNPNAMNNLSICFVLRNEGDSGLEAARAWREKARAVSPDDPIFGDSVRKILEEDRKLRALLADGTEDPDELYWAGVSLISGSCADFDPEEGVRRLQAAAEMGSVKAQHSLAAWGLQNDPEVFLRYARILAGNGDAKWQSLLAGALAFGQHGVKKNPSEAASWAHKAAEAGEELGKTILDVLDAQRRVDALCPKLEPGPDGQPAITEEELLELIPKALSCGANDAANRAILAAHTRRGTSKLFPVKLGLALCDSGRPEQAARILATVPDLLADPSLSPADVRTIATALVSANKAAAALSALRPYLRDRDPKDWRAWVQFALASRLLDDDDKVRIGMEQARKFGGQEAIKLMRKSPLAAFFEEQAEPSALPASP